MFKRKAIQTHLPCQIGEEFYLLDNNFNKDNFRFSKVTVTSITYDANGISIWGKFNHNPYTGTELFLNVNAFKTKAELITACGNS
jgi:hypothetical protein